MSENETKIPIETDEIPVTTDAAIVASATGAPGTLNFKGEILTAEEQAKVDKLVPEIKIDDDVYVASYGAPAQAEIVNFNSRALDGKRVYETGKSSQELVKMFTTHLTDFKQLEKPTGIQAFAEKVMGEIKWWIHKYEKINDFVDEARQKFLTQANELETDKNMNKEAKEVNYRNRRQLLIYLKAGEEAVKIAREGKLIELQKLATATQSPTDVENARNFLKMCDEFDTKLGRISCSLAITYVREPEIVLLLESERKSIALFNDLVNQAIPLWLDSMRTALDIKAIKQANETADSARAVTEGLFIHNVEQVGEVGLQTVKTANDGIIRTSVIMEGTDKLLAALAQVDAACKEAITNGEQYERDREANREKIMDYTKKSMA